MAGLSLALACVFGLLGAAAKLSGSRPLRWVAEVYTTVICGLPELVLMLAIFYGGQTLLNDLTEVRGWDFIDVPPFAAGVLTIGIIYGAYLTETFRGAILAVPRGQAEAALACGLSRLQVWRRVVLPQMVRHAIPGFANNWLVLVKATALVSIVGLVSTVTLVDVTRVARDMVATLLLPLEAFGTAAVIYFTLSFVLVGILRLLERRFLRHLQAERPTAPANPAMPLAH